VAETLAFAFIGREGFRRPYSRTAVLGFWWCSGVGDGMVIPGAGTSSNSRVSFGNLSLLFPFSNHSFLIFGIFISGFFHYWSLKLSA